MTWTQMPIPPERVSITENADDVSPSAAARVRSSRIVPGAGAKLDDGAIDHPPSKQLAVYFSTGPRGSPCRTDSFEKATSVGLSSHALCVP